MAAGCPCYPEGIETMFHKNRAWSVVELDGIGEVCDKLIEHDWTLCSGFWFPVVPRDTKGIVLLNDSTSEDALQEYAVCLASKGVDLCTQIESYTVSWMSRESLSKSLLEILGRLADGETLESYGTFHDVLEWEHEPCRYCA